MDHAPVLEAQANQLDLVLKNSFTLFTVSEGKPIKFVATSAPERDSWVESIENAIKQLVEKANSRGKDSCEPRIARTYILCYSKKAGYKAQSYWAIAIDAVVRVSRSLVIYRSNL